MRTSNHGDEEHVGLVELIGANRIFASHHAWLEAHRSNRLGGRAVKLPNPSYLIP